MPSNGHKDYAAMERMFDAFKAAYPREAWMNEVQVRRVLFALEPGPELFFDMLAALRHQAASGQKMPAPYWWLRDRRWNDPPEAWPPSKLAMRRERNARAGFESANQIARRELEKLAAAGDEEARQWLREHPAAGDDEVSRG